MQDLSLRYQSSDKEWQKETVFRNLEHGNQGIPPFETMNTTRCTDLIANTNAQAQTVE